MLHEFWKIVARQHGVIARAQLLACGFSESAIRHAIVTERLFPLWRGVYAVGRPDVTREGRWLAAALACGPDAVLSHASAAALWGIGEYEGSHVEVSVPLGCARRRPGIRVRRRSHLGPPDVTVRRAVPVTSPTRTLLDLAPRLTLARLERAINEAANLDLVTPEELRIAVDERAGQRGTRPLRAVLDRRTFRLTRSDLERRFLRLADREGLPTPETRVRLNGFEVDFYFPALGLVVETDGLRYHRTPAQQARDRLRDQAHAAAGLVTLRFTHDQVRHDPAHVRATLAAVAARHS